MSSVTQTIPSYTGGLSQQPDELKVPGQVTKAQNVLPDVTEGLMKRPGSQLIGSLMDEQAHNKALNSDHTGKWFHYYRDETEQYVGQIKKDGDVNIWRCSDGLAMTVNMGSPSPQSYLVHTGDEDLQTLTLNDFTYVTNRTKTVAMAGTTEAVRPPEAYIQLKKVAYASQYSVNLFDNTSTNTVTTATRVSAELINPGNDSMLPNVGTKIYSVNGIPEVQTIDLSSLSGSGWYEITDGTTTIGKQFSDIGSANSVSGAFKIAEGLRNDPDYHKLKFAVGHDVHKDDIIDGVVYGTALRLAFKEGGSQSNATLKKYDTQGGTLATTFTATETVAGVTSGTNSKENLYFRVTVTGQSVPHARDETPVYYGRYQIVIDLLHGGEGWTAGQVIEVGFRDCSIQVTIDKISTSKVQSNLGLVRPIPTSFDAKTVVTAESIIGSIRTNILGNSNGGTNTLYQWKDDEGNGYHCKQIGNGLYISRPTAQGTFNLSSPVGELLNVLTDSIKDVADLPSQCKHGYVVKVANSDAEEDDYYVKFFGHNDRDGEGVWEECAKPGTSIEYDNSTLPIQIKREANGSFTVSRITWDQAQVGDTAVDGTNPRASFVGYTINKLLFFRNRFVMLSDENVIMSRPGDFTNFWNKSAIQFTNTDPIDISCSSEYPAIVYDGIQVNSGLVLFTKNQQFMLTTDSDVLSPLTAKINFVSSYNFNYKTNPFSLGTTVGFLDNAGKNSRFMEMARVLREGEPDVIEQSKIVSKLLDKDLDLVSNSRENGLVFFSEKNKTTLYGFKYFNASDKRIQQSWFTWEFKNKIVHHAVLDDDLYVVTANSKYVTGQRVSRTSDTLTLTNHGLAQGDAIQWYNGGGTALVAGGVTIADGTTLYVSQVPDSNTFRLVNSAANAALGSIAVLSGGDNATQNIHYTSNKNVLQKIPLKLHTDSITVTDDKTTTDTTDDVIYKIHLDNMTTVASSSLAAYDAANDQTTFTLPTDFNLTSDLSAYVVPTSTDDTLQGLCQDVTITRVGAATSSTWTVNLPGNWKTYVDASGNTQTPANNIILGQKYDYEVKLPTIYYTSQSGESYRSDRRGSLVLHRLKLNFGNSGLYETLIERTGKDDYSEIWEPTLADNYLANQVVFEEEITRTVPIYDRNSNTSITIKSSHPSPATLYSMTWEGDYTNRFYTSV